MFIGQPAEEIGAGARMMLEDGLFKRFPKPDYALALHCDARLPSGASRLLPRAWRWRTSIPWTSSCKGRGGHGSAPHTTIDPIVLAARIILDLQTIVSRETEPARSLRRDGRLDPRRHQAQHHPERGEAADHRADDQGRRPQAHAGSDRADRQGARPSARARRSRTSRSIPASSRRHSSTIPP